jgi:hypothetical protein
LTDRLELRTIWLVKMPTLTALRLVWGLFALEVLGVLGWAVQVWLANPAPRDSAELSGGALRFGLDEEARRHIFQELVRGEPSDRLAAEARREDAIWDRNHDSYFHELEWHRIAGVAARQAIPLWQAAYILDEGIHEHWPPPPGVELRADDTPLAQRTQPLAKRAVITASPAN